MDLSNIGNKKTKRNGAFLKPGLPERGGRNFDAGLHPFIKFVLLKLSDRVDVGTGNNRPGNRTVYRAQNRDEFYAGQAKTFRPVANYTEKDKSLRLGGL